MHEYYKIEMKGQKKWLWDHALYLFLGGLAGGAFVVAALADLFFNPHWAEFARIGFYVAFPAAVVACGALFLGLGSPMKAVHSWKKPGTSWIARGVLIWTVFMAVAFLVPLFMLLEIQIGAGLSRLLMWIGLLAGIGVMVYTGLLLSAARPIALWSTGVLPMVFLLAALTSGFLVIVLFAALFDAQGPWQYLRWGSIGLLVLQVFAVFFHIQATHRVPEGRVAAAMLLKGNGATLFLGGAVLVGLVVPLAMLLFLATSKAVFIVAAVCGLAGNLCLRQAILQAGVFARLKAGRFEYVLTNP